MYAIALWASLSHPYHEQGVTGGMDLASEFLHGGNYFAWKFKLKYSSTEKLWSIVDLEQIVDGDAGIVDVEGSLPEIV